MLRFPLLWVPPPAPRACKCSSPSQSCSEKQPWVCSNPRGTEIVTRVGSRWLKKGSTETLNMRDEMLVIQSGPQPRSPPTLTEDQSFPCGRTPPPTPNVILCLGNCSPPLAFWKNPGQVLLYFWLLASSSGKTTLPTSHRELPLPEQ